MTSRYTPPRLTPLGSFTTATGYGTGTNAEHFTPFAERWTS